MSRLTLITLHGQMVERDWRVLADVARYRLLTSRQIQRLHFDTTHFSRLAAARACSRALGRLRDAGVLRALERRIGGVRAGSASYAWFPGASGERLLHDLAAATVGSVTEDGAGQGRGAGSKAERRASYREPSRHFVDHTLAVAEVAVRTIESARGGRFEIVDLETEPSNWQTMLTPHGVATFLKPDLHLVTATTTAAGEFEDHTFVEVDLATESTTVVARQCAAYEAFRASGRYQAQHGLFPAVWWLTPTQTRADALRAAVARSGNRDSTSPSELFRFCTFDDFPDVLETPD